MGLGMRASLVSMPFGMIFSPSIAIGLLHGVATRRNWDVDTHYFNVTFASQVGVGFYHDIAAKIPTHSLVGEWIFAACFTQEGMSDSEEFINEIVAPLFLQKEQGSIALNTAPEQFVEKLRFARSIAPEFVRQCASTVVATSPSIVGVTSVFQQHSASIALAKEIKKLSPSSNIVIGGANCEGEMGRALQDVAPWIDVVVSGEGEDVFDDLLGALEAGGQTALVGSDGDGSTRFLESRAISSRDDLDNLPIPNYSKFFEEIEKFGIEDEFIRAEVPLETARGCWWGEKHHCTFCGLNGQGMKFRSKTPDRAYMEIVELVERHPNRRIAVTDNILDMKYISTLLPRLASEGLELEAFWEVKSNLTCDQLRIIRAAGITHIQPGIESFSGEVLRLMKKGVRPIQNVQLLVDCLATGIEPGWNIIWGFPGESAAHYNGIADLLPALFHLHPPVGAGPVGIHRFSPMFKDGDRLGVGNKTPAPAYKFAFPFAEGQIDRIAYFFDGEFATSQDVSAYTRPVIKAVERWKAEHRTSVLALIDKGEVLVVIDTRSCRTAAISALRGTAKSTLMAASRAVPRDSLVAQLSSQHPKSDVEKCINFLLESRILIDVEGWVLSVAVPLEGGFQPDGEAAVALIEALRQNATKVDKEGDLLIA